MSVTGSEMLYTEATATTEPLLYVAGTTKTSGRRDL